MDKTLAQKEELKRVKIVCRDITDLKVDAIVNAANKSLMGGGGVDGAIHRAAGPQLKEETRLLGGAETGEAKLTRGYNLPAKYIIHTVGPVYRDGKHQEPQLLESCYVQSLKVALANGIKTIAFPSISTGVYGYPVEEAAEIAFHTVMEQLSRHNKEEIEMVYFVTFDVKTQRIYEALLEEY